MLTKISLDALSLAGVFLVVIVLALMIYLCNQRDNGCNDRSPPG